MRGRNVPCGIRLVKPGSTLLGSLFLALCFLIGAFVGYSYSAACNSDAQSSLSHYLREYCVLLNSGVITIPILRCALLYFAYSAAVLLASFSPLGVILIPLLAGIFGFFSMFTVSCFVLTFGRVGISAAVSLLLIRLLFTLPCFFLLSGMAWPLSARLFLLSMGRGRHCESVVYENKYFILILFCILILTIGVFLERILTPHLFLAAIRGLV